MPVLGNTLLALIFIVAVVMTVVWTLLPFAIFGIKPRLDQQTRELREIRVHRLLLERFRRRNALVACRQVQRRVPRRAD